MDTPQISHQYPVLGFIYTCFCLLAGIPAGLLNNVELSVRIAAGLFAMVSAGMAMRYYHFAIKEKKAALKKL